jgi:hypothetical protein
MAGFTDVLRGATGLASFLPGAGTAIAGGGQLLAGIVDAFGNKRADMGLLEDSVEDYKQVAQRARQRESGAQVAAQRGFTAPQSQALKSQLAQNYFTGANQMRSASNAGLPGQYYANLSGLSQGLNTANLDMAAQDALLRQQNQQYADTMGSTADTRVQQQIMPRQQLYNAQDINYQRGAASSNAMIGQGIQNVWGGLNNIARQQALDDYFRQQNRLGLSQAAEESQNLAELSGNRQYAGQNRAAQMYQDQGRNTGVSANMGNPEMAAEDMYGRTQARREMRPAPMINPNDYNNMPPEGVPYAPVAALPYPMVTPPVPNAPAETNAPPSFLAANRAAGMGDPMQIMQGIQAKIAANQPLTPEEQTFVAALQALFSTGPGGGFGSVPTAP